MVLRLVSDLIGLLVLPVWSRRSIQAENLLLRRQLALFKEREVKPRRIDAPTRLSLAWLSRLCDWRSCVIVVRPETIVRWHRAGWRLFWRFKSRRGRPPIPLELRQLIRRMATENPSWGEERIANELLLKLGLRVSPRTAAVPLVYISFPSAKDPDFARRHPGRATIDVITLARWDSFARWSDTRWKKRPQEYGAMKEKLTARLLDVVYRHLPQIRGRIDVCELSTPITTRHFSNTRT